MVRRTRRSSYARSVIEPPATAEGRATLTKHRLASSPVRPDYGGACLTEIVPTLLGLGELLRTASVPAWLPGPLREEGPVVLLVLDGLGASQFAERRHLAPTLSSMANETVTSVAPTTTATALTSIVTGRPPAAHGVVGYRVRVGSEVMNVLRWTTRAGDARGEVQPLAFQQLPAFLGRHVPVVTRADFACTGFTEAHLHGTELHGWRLSSSLPVITADLVRAGAPFVYAYYDGIDAVAHETGLGASYDAELAATDAMVADLIERLPKGAALAVTSDHGQVEVRTPPIHLDEDVMADVIGMSGEGRFRWLHAAPRRKAPLAARAEERYGEVAWVRTIDELVEGGFFGGPLSDAFASRLGDVALLAREAVSFADPRDGDVHLISRHGSLTSDEAFVPLLGIRR